MVLLFFLFIYQLVNNKPIKFIKNQNDVDIQNYCHQQICKFDIDFNYKIILDEKQFQIKINDKTIQQYQMPNQEPYIEDKIPIQTQNFDYQMEVNFDQKYIKATRYDNQFFKIKLDSIKFKNNFTQYQIEFPTQDSFGFGERWNYMNFKDGQKYVVWNSDKPADKSDSLNDISLYGHHPVILQREVKNIYDILFLKCWSAAEIEVNKNDQIYTITTIGGEINFLYFLGEKPEESISLYHEYIGGFIVPPFWSMGYHQCKWGYQTQLDIENVLKNFQKKEIPLEAFWMDIDYMDQKRIFTFGYGFDPEYINNLKKKYNKKLVPIVDPAIKLDLDFQTYKRGKGLYIKREDGQDGVIGQWAGHSVVVDFTNPKAQEYWEQEIRIFYGKLDFDGLWLDMNEVSNFQNGNIPEEFINRQYNENQYDTLKCIQENEIIPYKIANKQCLSYKTIDILNKNYDQSNVLENHQFYSQLQLKSTKQALQTVLNQKLPFILTRSSSYGTGRYSSHWTGDNISTFTHLRLSISNLFAFQIYGMPMVGADICGFGLSTNPQLCARWHQLGCLYPFTRNHNEIYNQPQEPFVFKGNEFIGIKSSIQFKYSILRHYYTEFLALNGKGTLFRPIVFEFNEDSNLLNEDIFYNQILIGKSLMATPVLYEDQKSVDAYFPQNTKWYDYHTGTQIELDETRKLAIQNQVQDLIPLFQLEGTIVQSQDISNVYSSSDLDDLVYLQFATNQNKRAKGKIAALQDLNNDNNVYQHCVLNNCLIDVEYSESQNQQIISFSIDESTRNNLDKVEEFMQIKGLIFNGKQFIHQFNNIIQIISSRNETINLRSYINKDKIVLQFEKPYNMKSIQYSNFYLKFPKKLKTLKLQHNLSFKYEQHDLNNHNQQHNHN